MKRTALVVVVLLGLAIPATASASLAGEQRQGQQLVSELQSGAKRCGDLSAEDFDHIGEYVMGRALGSVSTHQAMNERMRLMLGAQGEQRMHELMGRRFAGCGGAAAGAGMPMMGGGMMGSGNGGWGAMTRSGNWSWMTGGAWRSMSRQDWQRLERRWSMMGAASGQGHGWSAAAIVAVTAGGVLVLVLAAFGLVALARRPWRHPPAPHAP